MQCEIVAFFRYWVDCFVGRYPEALQNRYVMVPESANCHLQAQDMLQIRVIWCIVVRQLRIGYDFPLARLVSWGLVAFICMNIEAIYIVGQGRGQSRPPIGHLCCPADQPKDCQQ